MTVRHTVRLDSKAAQGRRKVIPSSDIFSSHTLHEPRLHTLRRTEARGIGRPYKPSPYS